jgi:hypothetical protein
VRKVLANIHTTSQHQKKKADRPFHPTTDRDSKPLRLSNFTTGCLEHDQARPADGGHFFVAKLWQSIDQLESLVKENAAYSKTLVNMLL